MTDFKQLIVYTAAYGLSFITGRAELSALSSISLISAAVFLYYCEKKRTGELLNLRGLMALGVLGGEGIARLQLSNLSTIWTVSTWLSFYIFYFLFFLISGFTEKSMIRALSSKSAPGKSGSSHDNSQNLKNPDAKSNEKESSYKSLFSTYKNKTASHFTHPSSGSIYRIIIISTLIVSYGAFIFEAVNLGFIPFFTVDMPHAYSYFHLKGVHYFTTLSVLIPAVTILYLEHRKKAGLKPDVISIVGLLMPLFLFILLVSRFQFMFAAILALFVAASSGKKYKPWQGILIFISLIGVYVIITVARAHSVSYLNTIFEMKNPDTPIFITQPYMYIANNYDNFNVMTEQLMLHSKGLRMLYPFFTLTGLKFFNSDLAAAFPLFTTKEELTTVTLLYDAWYDFGITGVVIFAAVLGAVTGVILYEYKKDTNPFSKLIYAELAFYYSVSFFTTWFSNPATWFYLGISILFYIIYRIYINPHSRQLS